MQATFLTINPRELNFSFYSLVAREPKLWLLYQPYKFWIQLKRIRRGAKPQEAFVSRDTEIVIDGYQGSANSFASNVFLQHQSQEIKIAHHMHSPAQIIRAVKYDLPVILVIREPEKAILSLASRWSYISVNSGLRSYINFYKKLRPFSNKLVISTFEQTTQDFDSIVEQLNIKHQTNFDLPCMNLANQKMKPPEANSKRKDWKKLKQLEFSSSENQNLLHQAVEVYQHFAEIAQKTRTANFQ